MIDISRLTPESVEEIEALIESFEDEESRQVARNMVAELFHQGSVRTSLDALRAPVGYLRQPISMEQFLADPYYMGNVTIWPAVRQDLIELFDGYFVEAVITAGIGYGKSFFSAMAAAYVIYLLSCLNDPSVYFGRRSGAPIYIVNQSTNREQAKRVIFGELKGFVQLSPFFQQEFSPDPRYKATELRFPRNIIVLPLASGETYALGLNVVFAALDEVSFMPVVQHSKNVRSVNEVYDAAEKMYNSVSRRLRSRFMKEGRVWGKIIMISSPKYEGDFMERKKKEAKTDKLGHLIFVREHTLWDTNQELQSDKKFQVELGGLTGRPRILTGDELPSEITGEIINVPDIPELRADFEKDIIGAVRDLAGRATTTTNPFLGDGRWLIKCTDLQRQHPFTSLETTLEDGVHLIMERLAVELPDGQRQPLYYPKITRYAHIDYALSNDECGIAVGCSPAMTNVRRRDPQTGNVIELPAPLIHIDLMMRIVPPKGREIDLANVRQILLTLRDWGFWIKRCTFDSFQSAEGKQHLRKQGIQSDVLSVDTDMQPYVDWKSSVEEERCRTYEYLPYTDEAKSLEIDRVRKKVDHPPGKDKGITDAVASVVSQATEAALKNPGMVIIQKFSDATEKTDEQIVQEEFVHELIQSRLGRLREALVTGADVNWDDIGKATIEAAVPMMQRLLVEARNSGNMAWVRYLIEHQRKMFEKQNRS